MKQYAIYPKQQMKKFFLYCIFLNSCYCAVAQQPVKDTIVKTAQKENKVSFKAALPPLTQIPGAPQPFYTYLWDFGDGHFSTSENPEHIYDKPGDYEAILYAVNNYDDGKKPGRKPAKVTVKEVNKTYLASVSPAESNFFKANGVFELRYNCMAKPGDTMVLTAGWKNTMAQNGKVYLFINEKQFGQNSFDTAGFRLFHEAALVNGQNSIASIRPFENMLITASGSPASHLKEEKKFTGAESKTFLQNTLKLYNNVITADVKYNTEQSQFMFANLFVAPGMIKDTNATITITGLFVPDSGGVYMHQLNIPVVTSHDPNKMNLKEGRMSYRMLKKSKALTYKVRFQNNGKGPARKILLDMTLPSAMDLATIRIKDMSPYCLPCDSVPSRTGCWDLIANNDSATFVFNGIYLPGTNQKGVDDKDSTKGFVEFTVKTKKKLDNLPFRSKTAIYFDKNEPVITNFATGRFKRSFSPVVMAGYEVYAGKGNYKNSFAAGVGLSLLSPHKPYWQAEAFFKQSSASVSSTVTRNQTIIVNGRAFDIKSFDSSTTFSAVRIALTPLQLRYNFNNFFAAGIGMRVDTDLSATTSITKNYRLPDSTGQGTIPYQLSRNEKTKAFSKFYYLPFIDIGLGRVRMGPAFGARYYYGGSKESYGYIYAAWRL
jgi:PKD repeat protein